MAYVHTLSGRSRSAWQAIQCRPLHNNFQNLTTQLEGRVAAQELRTRKDVFDVFDVATGLARRTAKDVAPHSEQFG